MKLIYLLKDVAVKTGYSIYTLKFYLKLGLIQEIGRSPSTRFRYFDETTIARLQRIRELRRGRRTLTEIKTILTHDSETHSARNI